MKSKFPSISSGFLVAAITVPAWADQATSPKATDLPQKGHSEWTKRAGITHKEPLGPISRADDLIGREVRNAEDEKLGTIDDLAIDTDSGRIAQVIVSSGGFLGLGDRLTAVPPDAFELTPDKQPLRLNISKERFKSAPRMTSERWDEASDSVKVAEVYRYYEVEPYFVAVKKTEVSADPGHQHLGHLVRASKVIGMPVKTPQGQSLGDVRDLLVDFTHGRVNQVLLSTGGFLGIADEVSVVPPTAMRFSNQDEHLVLDVSKETLLDSPRFQPDAWTEAQETTFIARVYESYKVDPYFDPNAPMVWPKADNSARNRPALQADTKTAEDQSNAASDLEITRDIRRAVVAKDGLSMNAQNIKIITVQGEVTLKGPVNSLWEKNTIEDLAASVVDRSKIDNQLEVSASVATR